MPEKEDSELTRLNRELADLERERKRYETMVPVDSGTYSSATREHALKVSDELIAIKKAEIKDRKKLLKQR